MPHSSLKILPGVDQNKTPALNEAAISQSQLIRFIPDRTMGGLVQKLGGWTQYPSGYTINLGSSIRALLGWEDTNTNSYLGIGADGISPIIVTGASNVGTTVTLSFVGPFSFFVGKSITVSGVDPTDYNGTFSITAATQTTVSYVVGSSPAAYVSGGLIYGGGRSLSVILNGSNPDITPEKLSSDATVDFSTTNGSNAVLVTESGRDTNNFWVVDIKTQVSVGGLILFGQYQVYNPGAIPGQYTIYATDVLGEPQNATSTVANGGVVPEYATTNGSSLVTVTLPDHGYAVGDTFTALVATSVGGITIYGNLTISAVSSSSVFKINASSSATSTASAYENNGDVRFVYYNGVGPLPPALGYGEDGYGFYGYGGVVPTTDRGVPINATDWTLDNWGETLIANPLSGPIFAWNPIDGNATAVCIANAPPVNQGMFVAMPQRQIVAWGSTFNGVTDPLLVRWCDVNNYDSWIASLTNQAGSYRIPKGSRIVQGIQAGHQALLWTDLGIWAMQYVGPPYVYQFNELGTGCGLIGRKAAGSMNGIVYWMGQSQFYRLAGSGVEPIRCPVWDVVFQELDTDNLDAIRVAPNSRFGEISWHFPMTGTRGITNISGNGSSLIIQYSGVGTYVVGSTITVTGVSPSVFNGSYVVISTSSNTVTVVGNQTELFTSGGTISGNLENNGFVKYNIILDQWDYSFNTLNNPYVARSAWINESVLGPPIGAALNYYLYQHETSPDAAGTAMSSYFQTGYFVLSEADVKMFIDQVWPDMKWGYFGGAQNANILITFFVTDYAGQSPTVYGPYTLTEATTYITPRFRGRLVSIRIQSTDSGSWWRLGNFRYRLQPDGRF